MSMSCFSIGNVAKDNEIKATGGSRWISLGWMCFEPVRAWTVVCKSAAAPSAVDYGSAAQRAPQCCQLSGCTSAFDWDSCS